jgi:hypothetical protein
MTCFLSCETVGSGHLKCGGTHAEIRFRLSAKWKSPFKSAGGRHFSRLLATEVCASAVVMLDTPCSEVLWRLLVTHCIRQFPHHFPCRASPCAITFKLESTSNSFYYFLFLVHYVRVPHDWFPIIGWTAASLYINLLQYMLLRMSMEKGILISTE